MNQPSQRTTRRQQIDRVLVITLLLNVAVATGKIATGLVSGALAITADGFHSLVDGTSNIIALVANRIAARPPDAEHPYGHRRFETLATLLIGIFLVVTAWEVGLGAARRLGGEAQVELSPLVFAVLIVTLLVNIGVTRYQIRQGRRLNSRLLLADAEHTRTDVVVTISVIFSSALVYATGHTWIDSAVALLVVALIGRAAWRILWETGSVLVDTAPYSPDQLAALVEDVPGVREVLRARSRGSVDKAHIDIDARVDAHMTTAQTEAITSAIRSRLAEALPQLGEIEVHFVPQLPSDDERDYALIARAAADEMGLSTHEVTTSNVGGQHLLEMHVEVPAEQSLNTAHQQVTKLEDALAQQLPEIDEIITHIEPLREMDSDKDGLDPTTDTTGIQRRALAALHERYPQVDWHQPRLYGSEGSLALTLHAALQDEMSVEAAHTLAEDAETLLRSEMPELARVTIHTEPFDHT